MKIFLNLFNYHILVNYIKYIKPCCPDCALISIPSNSMAHESVKGSIMSFSNELIIFSIYL